MVPRTVLTRSGLIFVNTAKRVNTVQPRTTVDNAGPMKNVINNAYSTTRRPFNKITTANNSNFTKKANTVKGTRVNTTRPKVVLSAVKENKGNTIKASACWVWRPQHVGFGDQSIKRMTGNRSYLTDYEEIDGGFVAFGDVYFVKELKFNLFDVSQMCDKKNSVLFTDTECVVLSPYFKLTNESHVFLKVPRKDNEYNVELKNVVPQGVAERKNRTLIEAARTMLADSKLPTTFSNEAVNTACFVQNKVLVIMPHNKTPYELFQGRKPALSFMRPFGCPVTILNTIDHLGQFDGKVDEGFFIGYSTNSKEFKIFNSRTRIVEENLHVQLSENTSNLVGNGPNWLFDIDALTNSMNYKPIVVGNQSNGNAGTKACDYAGKARMETDSPDARFKPSGEEEKKDADDPGNESGNPTEGKDSEVSKVNVVDLKTSIELPNDLNMPELEDIVYLDDDEDVGAEADWFAK
ncbi:ribonuclease H-like domain-containing protein [Tanacetum coccineum]